MLTATKTYKEKTTGKAVANNIHRKANGINGLRRLGIQVKLTIGQPNDKYEQEADSVADRVMTMSEPAGVQRSCASCATEELQTKPLFQAITPFLQKQVEDEDEEEPIQTKIAQRQTESSFALRSTEPEGEVDEATVDEDKEEPMQAKTNNDSYQTATTSIENSINQSKGQGSPLPDNTRSFMESRFGTDFRHIRVHNDNNAIQLNRQLSSQAFTKGSDIYFNSGKYNPESSSGKHLLAHELTHVIQQTDILHRQPTRAPSRRAQQIYSRMQKPLRDAVQNPVKIDKWNDDAVAGLVIIYNKMRNENIWQYVGEILRTSPRVSIDFKPKNPPIDAINLHNYLLQHNYVNCLSDFGTHWGLRKKNACGAHLHFKHFKKADNWINVHIDKVDPCCGSIPIISRIYHGLKHYFVDKRGWDKRKVKDFVKLLKDKNIPLSTGILRYLNRMP